MELTILNTREKKTILKRIKEQWNADFKTELVFLLSSKNRIYLMNNEFADIDDKKLRIDKMGMYFSELMRDEMRLSIEGSQMIGPIARKNVIELSDGETKVWMHGNNVIRKDSENIPGFVIIRNHDDFLGCGKLKNGEIMNFVPKTRRILSE